MFSFCFEDFLTSYLSPSYGGRQRNVRTCEESIFTMFGTPGSKRSADYGSDSREYIIYLLQWHVVITTKEEECFCANEEPKVIIFMLFIDRAYWLIISKLTLTREKSNQPKKWIFNWSWCLWLIRWIISCLMSILLHGLIVLSLIFINASHTVDGLIFSVLIYKIYS